MTSKFTHHSIVIKIIQKKTTTVTATPTLDNILADDNDLFGEKTKPKPAENGEASSCMNCH